MAALTPILSNAASPDAAARSQAEVALSNMREQNYGAFVVALAQELAGEDKPAVARQMAGILLKNNLDAADTAKKVIACGSRPFDWSGILISLVVWPPAPQQYQQQPGCAAQWGLWCCRLSCRQSGTPFLTR